MNLPSPFVRFPWLSSMYLQVVPMEQRTLKSVNNCFNTNIKSHLETSGSKSYNLYLNVVHFFNYSKRLVDTKISGF